MGNNEEKHHIVPYRTFLLVLVALLVFTFISIGVTSYDLGPLTVVAALVLAACKTFLVLSYFMHLKFDVRMFAILVTAVLVLIAIAIPFLVVFLRNRKRWRALIPAYVLVAVALMIGLEGAGILREPLVAPYVACLPFEKRLALNTFLQICIRGQSRRVDFTPVEQQVQEFAFSIRKGQHHRQTLPTLV